MENTNIHHNHIRNDLFLLAGVMLAALLMWVVFYFFLQKPGSSVKITVAGKVYGTYSLEEDQIIEINSSFGENTVKIENSKVSVVEADCPDLICVKHFSITKSGETICCLPHKMVVEIILQEEEGEVDGIAQ